MLRIGATLFLLGITWAAVSLQTRSGYERRSPPHSDNRTAEYVTPIGSAVVLSVGTALLGFALTM